MFSYFRFLPQVLLALVLFTASSCSFVTKEIMGIRSFRTITDREHHRFLRKLHASPDMAFYADSNFVQAVQNLYPDSNHFRRMQNQFQPLQVVYFGHSDYRSFHMINCYAPGFPRLSWNKDGRFDQFPPGAGVPVDSVLPYSRISQLVQPFGHNKSYVQGPGEPYTAVLFWCRSFFLEAKRLNRYVIENLKKSNEPYRILYVNTDQFFANE